MVLDYCLLPFNAKVPVLQLSFAQVKSFKYPALATLYMLYILMLNLYIRNIVCI